MAMYDHGGGCPCGLMRECDCANAVKITKLTKYSDNEVLSHHVYFFKWLMQCQFKMPSAIERKGPNIFHLSMSRPIDDPLSSLAFQIPKTDLQRLIDEDVIELCIFSDNKEDGVIRLKPRGERIAKDYARNNDPDYQTYLKLKKRFE